jgi:hypothetical protein
MSDIQAHQFDLEYDRFADIILFPNLAINVIMIQEYDNNNILFAGS